MKKKLTFVVYLFGLLLFVIFKVLPKFDCFWIHSMIADSRAEGYHKYNLIPFKTIVDYAEYVTMDYAFINLLGNLFPFMPFGFFLPLCWEKMRFWNTALVGFLFSLVCEILQDVTMTGYFDVDDIIMNMCGVLLGYGCYFVFRFVVKKIKKHKESA